MYFNISKLCLFLVNSFKRYNVYNNFYKTCNLYASF